MIEETTTPQPPAPGWWNRTVLGAGLTSFLADLCYETVLSVLPHFLRVLQIPVFYLGMMEGAADALSSFVKLGIGWWSDRLPRRKPLVVLGYALTGLASYFFAVAVAWPIIMLGRLVAWLGKGVRGPLRNALLADAVAPADRGKAFGLHRAGDTLGAIVGPLLGFLFLREFPSERWADPSDRFRVLFLLTIAPGLASAFVFALTVPETRRTEATVRKFWASLTSLPRSFRRWLIGVGVFGLGDFSHTLLIVAAVQLLSPQIGTMRAEELGTLLYGVRNVAHVLVALAAGGLGDRFGRAGLMTLGYVLGTLVMGGFVLAFVSGANLAVLGVLFALAGAYLAIEETLEPALTADFVPDRSLRGTAYGVLGVVNGVGDFVSSLLVGALWMMSPITGMAFAAIAMFLGTILQLTAGASATRRT